MQQRITRGGKRYVMVEEHELRRLKQLAAKASASQMPDNEAPPALPPADKDGSRPAVEFARASIARSIFNSRNAVGMSQQELARRAGVRQETVSRLESGKHSPTLRTIEKIERALQAAFKQARKPTK